MAHSFRQATHLPHHREVDPPDPAGLPRQRRGTTPQMHGRYPDYDVLENAGHWDEVTRGVVLARVQPPGPLRFFSPQEARTLRTFLDVVLAQDAEPRVPVLEAIDARLHARSFDGYRYADMPTDDETWRAVARMLDGFADLRAEEQRERVAGFARGEFDGDGLNVTRAWAVVMRYALGAFYSHPWAWNEIGFRGPAYPRGYMRRNMGPSGTDPDEPSEAFGLDPVRDVSERAGQTEGGG